MPESRGLFSIEFLFVEQGSFITSGCASALCQSCVRGYRCGKDRSGSLQSGTPLWSEPERATEGSPFTALA